MTEPTQVNVLTGDNRKLMRKIKAGSVHCVVTSPPYWKQRDYGHSDQIGQEETPEAYVRGMVQLFRKVRRVLRDDGVVWLNLGDTYSSGGNGGGGSFMAERKDAAWKGQSTANGWRHVKGLKEKELVGIPWRVAFALQKDGWYLRQDVIWGKKSPMPESVTDRCTKAHEYVFLLSKNPKYFFDHEAIKEPAVFGNGLSTFTKGKTAAPYDRVGQSDRNNFENRNKRGVWREGYNTALVEWMAEHHPELLSEFSLQAQNKESLWMLTNTPYPGAHFAVFPPEIPEICILAGSPEYCCSICGKGHKRIIESERVPTRPGTNSKVNRASQHEGSPANKHNGSVVGNRDPLRHTTRTKTVGFEPDCKCSGEAVPSTVFDPFWGSGTTGQVAQELRRNVIGIELNPDYVQLSKQRTANPVLF